MALPERRLNEPTKVHPLFLEPAGLAVGLALKELRYGQRSDSPPGLMSLWFPHSLAYVARD